MMELTMLLAGVIGVMLAVGGLSGPLYPERAQKALREVEKSYVLPYFDGVLALVFGLFVVLTHNIWEGLDATLVTLVGWLALIEGFAMLLLPRTVLGKVADAFGNRSMVTAWSVLALVVGGYLTYVGLLV